MRAVLKTQPCDRAFEIAEVREPDRGPGEVLVEIEAAGICGTDVAIRHWRTAVVGQYAPRFPLIVGHEFGGRILDPGGSSLARGTLVAVNPQIACGACRFCDLGRPTLCVDRRLMGGRIDGGWTERVSVPQKNLFAFPCGTDPALASLAEPMSVAAHAVCERAPTQAGDVVVVIGAGPIGLLCAIFALNAGASKVFVTGLDADEARLRLAEELGAVPLNVERADPSREVTAAQWDGADVVYETSGSPAVVSQALALARRGGRVGVVGLCHGESRVATTPLVLRELEVIGSRGYNDTTWATLMRIVPRVADSALRLISHRLPLEAVEDAIALVESRRANKVLLSPKLA
ncbi:alcohol dehydrogenase catalytic domain-containing protein [Aureimonas sp. ME7]|uniref:zinc-dependent alcohol dehydrogenase n=1 Tax=Aureimonas sp. ME7 TaxID=2744252 RepID=UPI0015F66424|nr:alcohol dehydrogenase catalytic domain-containing protein [Aureimonas sp. ME7]